MGKRSQRKGRSGEIELAKILTECGFQMVLGNPMTFGKEPDIRGLPGIHIEVKRVERLNVSSAMKQAILDSERFDDGMPTVFHRKNREGWLVTMRLDDFLTLYRTHRNEA